MSIVYAKDRYIVQTSVIENVEKTVQLAKLVRIAQVLK
jgi:hypothetical protein